MLATGNLLKGLNDHQKTAVSLGWGPSLIVAGAGSGKTTVLTRRVAYLMTELHQSPDSILAVTFTNKAAEEMKHRLQKLVGGHARHILIGTFHSFCARALREEIENYKSPEGYTWKHNFVIYDETDKQSVVKNVVNRLNLDEKVFSPREMCHRISSLKNDGYMPARYANEARNYKETRVAEIFSAYQSDLAKNNALDFDDLILTLVELLRQNLAVRRRFRERFQHVLVDEFQDTNQSQYELIRLIVEASDEEKQANPASIWHERSLLVVGDVDQSIYSWRKADFRIILGFQSDFKESKIVKLEDNYRSTSTILEVANSIIQNNTERIEKVLRSSRGAGTKVKCFEAQDEIDEAYFVQEELKRLSARGRQLSNCVILYRTNAQSRAMEEVLVRSHQPYTVVGGTRFYERQEIKDVLGYLKLIFNGADGQAFMRVINTPRRGLGKTTLERLVSFAFDRDLTLLDAAKEIGAKQGVSEKSQKALRDFANMVKRRQAESAQTPISEILSGILKETGYLDKLKEDAAQGLDELASGRIENVMELHNVAKEFESMSDKPDLEAFLTRIALVSDIDQAKMDEDCVKLMTIHSAKGLEFPVVFILGLEEGLFPHMRSLDSPNAMEEERRLMYVAVTRAADLLYLTYARKRAAFGWATGFSNFTIPSRFLKEISPQHMTGFYPSPETPSNDQKEDYDPWDESTWAQKKKQPSPTPSAQRPADYARSSKPQVKPRAFRQQTPPQQTSSRIEPKPKEESIPFEKLSVGDKVQHVKFGIGEVTQIIGDKDKELYNVDFKTEGKRLMDPRFAKLVKLT